MGETGYLNQHVPGHQNVTTPWKQTDALTWPVKIYDTSATVQSDARRQAAKNTLGTR